MIASFEFILIVLLFAVILIIIVNGSELTEKPSRGERRLTFSEGLTLLVGIGSLVVSYFTYRNAADTSDLQAAVNTLANLATQTKRQADAQQGQLDQMKATVVQGDKTVAALNGQLDALRGQIGQMAAANSINSQNMIESNRAWLWPKITDITFDGTDLYIKGDIINTGKSPALGQSFQHEDMGFESIPNLYPNPVPIHYKDICAGGRPIEGNSIFPNQSYGYNRVTHSFDNLKSHVEAVRDGTEIFYVQGCVIYFSFMQIRTSPYCFYVIKSPMSQQPEIFHCPKGNGAT